MKSNLEFNLNTLKGILSGMFQSHHLYPHISYTIYMSKIVCKIKVAVLAPH